MRNEVAKIKERYARRKTLPSNLYSPLNFDVNLSLQEKQRSLLRLLKSVGIKKLSNLKIIEIGCGTGSNLLELIQLGANPKNLVGCDLLEDRINNARDRLPSSVRLFHCDASSLNMDASTFDIVYQSVVFSSILNKDFQISLAKKMWDLIHPGGFILWYDFLYNNPKNKDVKGIPLERIKQLFPDSTITFEKITLAPPIARYIVNFSPNLYHFLNYFQICSNSCYLYFD